MFVYQANKRQKMKNNQAIHFAVQNIYSMLSPSCIILPYLYCSFSFKLTWSLLMKHSVWLYFLLEEVNVPIMLNSLFDLLAPFFVFLAAGKIFFILQWNNFQKFL